MGDLKLILTLSLKQVNANSLALTRAVLVPLMGMLILILIAQTVAVVGVYLYFWLLCNLLLLAFLMISVHRIIILNAGDLPRWRRFAIKKREVYFSVYIACFLIVLAMLNFLRLIPIAGDSLFYISAVYLMARIILVFPAISIDRYWSFYHSWLETSGHQLLMIYIAGIIFSVLWLAEKVSITIPVIGPYLYVLFFGFLLLISTVLLSVAFKIISSRH